MALNIECCWIQTISDRQNQKLALAADRGFNDAMRTEILSMDLKHRFSGEIIGAGNKIAIPDLNHDGAYGLASFRTAGYKWLVAVPLLTYRVYGLLGTACRNKRNYDKNTAGLMMVVAGLIANALSKAELTRNFQPFPKPVTLPVQNLETAKPKEDPILARIIKKPVNTPPSQDNPPENKDDDVLARLLKNRRALSATLPLRSPGIPAEETTGKANLNSLKTSRPPDSPPLPPPVSRPVKQPEVMAENKIKAEPPVAVKIPRVTDSPPASPPVTQTVNPPEAVAENKAKAETPVAVKISRIPDSPPPQPLVNEPKALPDNKVVATPTSQLRTSRPPDSSPPPPPVMQPETPLENQIKVEPPVLVKVSRAPDSQPPLVAQPETLPENTVKAEPSSLAKVTRTLESPLSPPVVKPVTLPENKTGAKPPPTINTVSIPVSPQPPLPVIKPEIPPENKIEAAHADLLEKLRALESHILQPLFALPDNESESASLAPMKTPGITLPPLPPETTPAAAPVKKPVKPTSPAFTSHPRKTISFREAHRKTAQKPAPNYNTGSKVRTTI